MKVSLLSLLVLAPLSGALGACSSSDSGSMPTPPTAFGMAPGSGGTSAAPAPTAAAPAVNGGSAAPSPSTSAPSPETSVPTNAPLSMGMSAAPTTGAGTTPASSADGMAPAGTAAPCPGVSIMPDATGLVAAGSNSLGIHGSWFAYSDCNDLKNQNCASVTAPTGMGFSNVGGKMCTTGQTSSAAGAWGAGLGLELNDAGSQMPYDMTANGVKGFCFVLSGATIPSTSIRVAFPTVGNQDGPYFESVSTAGQHTVLFSDTAQGSWVTPKSDFQPTQVTLLQFQIPSETTAPVPWDFCIEGLTAITE